MLHLALGIVVLCLTVILILVDTYGWKEALKLGIQMIAIAIGIILGVYLIGTGLASFGI